ncbi:hypothetical protein [Oceanobacillus sp. J11TS1]|uniref:hypothetical protein n=1 Tax=Oceanobacillus sp. J11TS1 TaxID=2807191 RepID=UPI001B175D2C|nr:hypothetical protein [Oceanobacillus sp. J11TS1]GIO21549.1 hypothetical protein J11TS1_01300 [Oceanobacillus sp. J11TS1]
MSDFFLNMPADSTVNQKSTGDKLVYYGTVVMTLGSIISLIGSTILYYEDTEEPAAFEENTPVTNRQLVEMQQQLTVLQQKMDQLENQGQ